MDNNELGKFSSYKYLSQIFLQNKRISSLAI